ncbi:MAG: four helix bundle protein [Melioribacteraceae bacterium]
MHNFKDLIVWQKARLLVKDIYNLVADFPEDEKFGIVSQIKRAVISIASNIAEGAARNSDKDFIRFLDIANGSAFELETQLYLAFDLGFINNLQLEKYIENVTEIEKMIYGFKNKLIQI